MPTAPQEPADGVASDSVSRNAAFAVVTRLTTAAITAFLALFLARKLGPQVYGYLALAMAIANVASFLADLGITAATPRFLAERGHSRSAVASVLGEALRLKALAAVPVSVLLFVLAGPLTSVFDAPEADWALRGMAIATLAQGFFLFVIATFEALGRIAVNLRVVALESLLEGSAVVVLVLLGGGAAGAAFGRAIGYTIGAAIAFAYILRVVGAPRIGSSAESGLRPRDIARYAGALLIIDALFRAFAQIDVLLIGAIVGGGRAVGLFDLPMQIAWFLHYPAGAAASAVAPRLARRPGHEPQVDTFAHRAALHNRASGHLPGPDHRLGRADHHHPAGRRVPRVGGRAEGADAVHPPVGAGAARVAGRELPRAGPQAHSAGDRSARRERHHRRHFHP